jgi:hypothetical protein
VDATVNEPPIEIWNRAEILVELEPIATIPPGEYRLLTGRGRRVRRFGRQVFELPCRIIEDPRFSDCTLLHYLNLPAWVSRARRYAKVSGRSKLGRELRMALNGGILPKRGVPLGSLEHKQFVGRVGFQQHDYRNRPVPPREQVSVVTELIERLA